MKSMEEMLAAAQKAAETIQQQMGDAQAKLDSLEVEGVAGGGLVKIRATASVTSSSSALPELWARKSAMSVSISI